MQFLYQGSIVLFTTIMYCVTQRTQFNGMESLFTLNVSSGNSYPFCVWPANITTTECDESVSLLCVIQSCHHGPSIVVGGKVFTSNSLAKSCVRSPNSTDVDGTWVVHLMLSVSDVAQNWSSNEPVPMYCATSSSRSEVAHLSIPKHCSDPVTSLTSSAIIPTLTSRSIHSTVILPIQNSASPISSTRAPLSSTISATVSPTPQNSAHGMETFSLVFTLILSFFPSLLFFDVFFVMSISRDVLR